MNRLLEAFLLVCLSLMALSLAFTGFATATYGMRERLVYIHDYEQMDCPVVSFPESDSTDSSEDFSI